MKLAVAGLLLAIFLAACSAGPVAPQAAPTDPERDLAQENAEPEASSLETVVDQQGAVSVAVTPAELGSEAPALDFEVAMNTHSVELSMDLAQLATLTTDNGRSVVATLWDAPSGGHHVSGTLSFPATVDGAAVLEGATRLTLTIRGVDAPERIFTWPLS